MIGIYPIFNVSYLYTFKGKNEVSTYAPITIIDQSAYWEKELRITKTNQIEAILGQKIVKKTRDKEYFQCLVKWKNHLLEHATWMTTINI